MANSSIHCPAPRRALVVACLMALAAGIPATAWAAPDRTVQSIGDWTLAPAKDGTGCFVSRSYDRPGGTTLLLGIDLEGANHLTVLNANWSIRAKERLKLDFRVSAGSYMKHFAVGIVADGKRGFVTSFETKFPTYLASSKVLAIARGDVPVERLDLTGSGAAIAALRTCVEAQRQKPKASTIRKAAGSDIPIDPFAPRATGRKRK